MNSFIGKKSDLVLFREDIERVFAIYCHFSKFVLVRLLFLQVFFVLLNDALFLEHFNDVIFI